LSFDTTGFSKNLFTIDEEYTRLKAAGAIVSARGAENNLMTYLNPNSLSLAPHPVSANALNKIYKLCKTDEDFGEDDDDDESLERANELFNSMLKK